MLISHALAPPKKQLKKLYKEFTKLHNQKKIKHNDSVYIKGSKRTWKVETPTIKLIEGKKRNWLTKKNSHNVKGLKRTWTIKNKAKSK